MQSSRVKACALFRSRYLSTGISETSWALSFGSEWFSCRSYHPIRTLKTTIKASWYAHLVASHLRQLNEEIVLAPRAFQELAELASGFHQRVGQRLRVPCLADGILSEVIILQTFLKGRRIFYMASALIGAGGGGEVYKGLTFPMERSCTQVREVAIKMASSPKCLSEEPLHSPQAHRLIREAALLRELHAGKPLPGVQQPPWNVFTVEDRAQWLTCYAGELYRGDARASVPAVRLTSKQLLLRLKEMRRLAAGLAHIHRKGFLHGDIDLRNLFQDSLGFVIGDFGNSRRAPEGHEGAIKMRREVRDLARAISALLAPARELAQWCGSFTPKHFADLGVPEEQAAVMVRALSSDNDRKRSRG